MRHLLALAVAAVAVSAVPASAAYLVSTGCRDGDWQVVEVSSGGHEYVEVCIDDVRPTVTVSRCVLHPLDCLKVN